MTLSEARNYRKITWLTLASLTGLTQNTLSLIAQGHVFPRVSTQKKINQALKMEVDFLETAIRKPFVHKISTPECREDTVIKHLFHFVKTAPNPENAFIFLHDFLNRYEDYLADDKRKGKTNADYKELPGDPGVMFRRTKKPIKS